MKPCVLCRLPDEEMIWQDEYCFLVAADAPESRAFPGYCRVVWRNHVAEMTDLDPKSRRHLLRVVFAVEHTLRLLVAPDKINVASLGNLVPHLHWHIIPRWCDDSHFPAPIWAEARRPGTPRVAPPIDKLRSTLVACLLAEETEQ